MVYGPPDFLRERRNLCARIDDLYTDEFVK
jgi:hypothetical protein